MAPGLGFGNGEETGGGVRNGPQRMGRDATDIARTHSPVKVTGHLSSILGPRVSDSRQAWAHTLVTFVIIGPTRQ